jgi:hypothetical protein
MRLIYFKQLISKFKKQQKESKDSEAEESIMLDYLVKMQDTNNCGEPTHFSGIRRQAQHISQYLHVYNSEY